MKDKTKCNQCKNLSEGKVIRGHDHRIDPKVILKATEQVNKEQKDLVDSVNEDKVIKEYDKNFLIAEFTTDRALRLNREFLKKAIKKTKKETENRILTDLIKIADQGEIEDLRREVTYYFENL